MMPLKKKLICLSVLFWLLQVTLLLLVLPRLVRYDSPNFWPISSLVAVMAAFVALVAASKVIGKSYQGIDVKPRAIPCVFKDIMRMNHVTFLENRLNYQNKLVFTLIREDILYQSITHVSLVRSARYGVLQIAGMNPAKFTVSIVVSGFGGTDIATMLKIISERSPQAQFNDEALRYKNGDIPILGAL